MPSAAKHLLLVTAVFVLALWLASRTKAEPVTEMMKRYPDVMGYCCDHEDCRPAKPGQLVWPPLGGPDGSYRLRKPGGGFYEGRVKAYSKYDMIMPKGMSADTYVCVYQGEFRCILRKPSGQ